MRTDIKIKASDNALLSGYIWKKDENSEVNKVVILAHGMAEHIERYDEFANKLANNGYLVIGYNQRGHKDTSSKEDYGYMGDCDNFKILVSDYHDVVLYVAGKYPNAKRYGFGHSMGSFVLNRYIQLYNDLNKAVLCGTGKNPTLILSVGAFLDSCIRLFKGKRHRSKIIDNLSFGAYNKKFAPNRTAFDWLNTVDEEVDKYINDEYCGGIFTLKYFHDFFKGCIKVNKNQKHISNDLPILLISGDQDPVGNMGKGTTQVYNDLKKLHNKVELKLIPGERHEIMLEKSKDQTHQFVIDWLNKE